MLLRIVARYASFQMSPGRSQFTQEQQGGPQSAVRFHQEGRLLCRLGDGQSCSPSARAACNSPHDITIPQSPQHREQRRSVSRLFTQQARPGEVRSTSAAA